MAKSSKGSEQEREICKFLSKWVQGTEKPYLFWRGSGSGSLFTNSFGTVGDQFAGDLYAVSEEGKFFTDKISVESKNGYPRASLDLFLKYNKADVFKDFWIQTVRDAGKTNKEPMLIYKKKGMPVHWVCISRNLFNKFDKYLIGIRSIILTWVDLPDMVIFQKEEFFERVTPEIFKKEFELDVIC